MKIVFLCGCLEPGKDGVGDYIRTLSVELVKQEHSVTAIALNDTYVSNIQSTSSINFSIIRYPFSWSEYKRFSIARSAIEKINPDSISIQFVIYSYHNKGLPFSLNKRLKEVCGNRNCHVMFHELWIGFTKISPLKHKITGHFQRKIVLSIVKSLSPSIVTTTNKLYQCILKDNKIEANILPLFSNIPLSETDENFASKLFTEAGSSVNKADRPLVVGIFGNLSYETDVENLLAEQLKFAEDLNKKVLFISFGKVSAAGLNELYTVEAKFEGKVKFLYLGEQCAENVSKLLQILDVGFSGTPAQHIGKSGVFAAMKLHGVKVIVPKGDMIPEYHDRIQQYNEELMNRPASDWSVNHIANNFSRLLQAQLK